MKIKWERFRGAIGGGFPTRVATITAAKALTTTEVSTGGNVHVSGADIQGGGFYISASNPYGATALNGVVFTMDDGRFLVREIDDFVTPEMFNCDPTGATDNVTEMQAFVDFVTAKRFQGVGVGLYQVSDTITVTGNGYSLQLGKAQGSVTEENYNVRSGLLYSGVAGAGAAPNTATPVLKLYRCNWATYPVLNIQQNKSTAVANTLGILVTGNDDSQRGNSYFGEVNVSYCERGVAIGLNEFITPLRDDCFEACVVDKMVFVGCRHPVYISSLNTDNMVFNFIHCSIYNTGGNVPAYYTADPTLTCDVAFEMNVAGNLQVNHLDINNIDMTADTGIAIEVGAGNPVFLRGSLELSGCKAIVETNAAASRNPNIYQNIQSSEGLVTSTGLAALFIGNSILMNCSFAGNVEYRRNIRAYNTGFWWDGAAAKYAFVTLGGLEQERSLIVGTVWFQNNASAEEGFSGNYIPYADLLAPTLTSIPSPIQRSSGVSFWKGQGSASLTSGAAYTFAYLDVPDQSVVAASIRYIVYRGAVTGKQFVAQGRVDVVAAAESDGTMVVTKSTAYGEVQAISTYSSLTVTPGITADAANDRATLTLTQTNNLAEACRAVFFIDTVAAEGNNVNADTDRVTWAF